jgi:uncharacterized protein YcbX
MPVVGKVIELWRYPVSTVGGEQVEMLEAAIGGLPDDRNFGLVDRETGAVARPMADPRWRSSLEIRCRLSGRKSAEIRVPGHAWQSATSEDASAALSAYFGFPVAVRPYADASSGMSGQTSVNRYEPSDLHLLTTASIAELQALHPAGNPDRRRFRPNVLIEMPAEPGNFPDSNWIGRAVRIGEVVADVSEPTRRCGLTTVAQGDIAEDQEILRQLVRRNNHNLGVYATIRRPGTIRIGDVVELH